ncbi:MAG TPA: glycosyltransferase [Vicinamibacterales bacterium]|nr:glycosyltransferase [Vicinamibacterales bacterium]
MISFVVPAYNEERLIGATLDAIHAAARDIGGPYEVVVANDSSTDRTPDIAREHGARVVDCHHRQIARVRNTGARATTGDVLIFVDADTLISTAVVRASLAALGRGAVGGGSLPDIEGRMPWWGPMVLLAVDRVMRLMRWAAGCCVFVTRAAFEAAGGFDERVFVSEELFLSQALKKIGRVVILRERVVTSGRKLRTHSAWDMIRLFGLLFVKGRKLFMSRDELSFWYGERRHD